MVSWSILAAITTGHSGLQQQFSTFKPAKKLNLLTQVKSLSTDPKPGQITNITRYSKQTKLYQITAYVTGFINNRRQPASWLSVQPTAIEYNCA